VPDRAVGVVGPRDKTTVRDETLVGREAIDAVEFKVNGEGRDLTDAVDTEEPLVRL
jgi:hypothetical protein